MWLFLAGGTMTILALEIPVKFQPNAKLSFTPRISIFATKTFQNFLQVSVLQDVSGTLGF